MKHLAKKIALLAVCCFTLFTACQDDDDAHVHDEASHSERELLLMPFDEVMALLKNEKIKNSLREESRSQVAARGIGGLDEEAEELFEVIDVGTFVNYSLYMYEWTEERPYHQYFIVTVDAKDSLERAAYLRYHPDDVSVEFIPKTFSGRLEVLDINGSEYAAATFKDGRVIVGTTVRQECTIHISTSEVPCSHGGGHGVGETCTKPGVVNDAHYILNIATICKDVRDPVTVPPNMVGGGGKGGISYVKHFEMSLNPSQRSFYLENKISFDEFLNHYQGIKNFAKYLIDKGINEGTPNKVLSFLNAWKYGSMPRYHLNQHMSRNGDSTQSREFVIWAAHYLKDNPNVTFEKFQNWFMGNVDGIESIEAYDAQYWQNSTLSFQQQQLPTATIFLAAYPPRSKTAQQLCTEIGGQILTLHNNIVNSGQRMNTCAVRLSRALNYSGITLPNIPGKTKLGGDGKYYFTFASDITFWMMYTFGINIQNHPFLPTNLNHLHLGPSDAGVNGAGFANRLSESIGIFVMIPANSNFGASGHCDALLNGGCIGSNCYYAHASDIHVWLLD